jgi:hypothetical protein
MAFKSSLHGEQRRKLELRISSERNGKVFRSAKREGMGRIGGFGSAGVERGSDCVTGMGRWQDLFWDLAGTGIEARARIRACTRSILAFVIQEDRAETGCAGLVRARISLLIRSTPAKEQASQDPWSTSVMQYRAPPYRAAPTLT